MANPAHSRIRFTNSGQFVIASAPAKELAIFRNTVTRLTNDPGKLRALVVKAGIATPSGKLKKIYGG